MVSSLCHRCGDGFRRSGMNSSRCALRYSRDIEALNRITSSTSGAVAELCVQGRCLKPEGLALRLYFRGIEIFVTPSAEPPNTLIYKRYRELLSESCPEAVVCK